jgi:hypothetical protein
MPARMRLVDRVVEPISRAVQQYRRTLLRKHRGAFRRQMACRVSENSPADHEPLFRTSFVGLPFSWTFVRTSVPCSATTSDVTTSSRRHFPAASPGVNAVGRTP